MNLAVLVALFAAAWAQDDAAAREAELFGAPTASPPPPPTPEPAPTPEPTPSPTPGSPPAPAEPVSEEAAREADLFGAPAPQAAPQAATQPTTPTEAQDREADLFGAPAPSPTAPAPLPSGPAPVTGIQDKIADQDKTFTLGGRLWLRLDGQLFEGTDGPEDVDLSSPNNLELFADARPNDRVRAYVRARLTHDWTVHETATDPTGATFDAVTGEPVETTLFGTTATTNQVLLDQLWVKFDVRRKVYATVGRQRVKWGAGRFWNPSDFLNQQRLDPLAVFDLRTGVSLVRLHVPFEAAGGNVYAIANLDQATALDEVGGAARVEWLFGQTEVTASTAVRKDQPLRLGADVSSGVSVLDLRAEAALQHGNAPVSWQGTWDYTVLPPEFPTERRRDDDWIPQVVVGADVSARYSDQDSVTFGAEYFYNDAGYDDADLLPWLFFAGGYSPLYIGKHYLAGYALLAGPGRWDDHSFTGSFIGNLSDRSQIARLDYRANVLTWLDINLFVAQSFGQYGELHFRMDLPRMPDEIAALCGLDPSCAPYAEVFARRLVVPASTTSFGSGLAVRF